MNIPLPEGEGGGSSTPGEEGGEEVEEILGVDDAVGVEVGGGGRGEKLGEEVEEILGVDGVVVVEVGAAGWDEGDEVGGVIEVDPADVLPPGVAAKTVGSGSMTSTFAFASATSVAMRSSALCTASRKSTGWSTTSFCLSWL